MAALRKAPTTSSAGSYFFIGALKNAGEARVTAVVPFLCYARKDRRTKPIDPVITRYVASLLTAVGSRRTSRPDRRAAQIFPSRVFGAGRVLAQILAQDALDKAGVASTAKTSRRKLSSV